MKTEDRNDLPSEVAHTGHMFALAVVNQAENVLGDVSEHALPSSLRKQHQNVLSALRKHRTDLIDFLAS